MAATKRCEGKRRKWRGATLGTFACGRKATHVFETNVGLNRRHWVCDGEGSDECLRSITSGYPASNMRALAPAATPRGRACPRCGHRNVAGAWQCAGCGVDMSDL